jgi:hypothetical protein
MRLLLIVERTVEFLERGQQKLHGGVDTVNFTLGHVKPV